MREDCDLLHAALGKQRQRRCPGRVVTNRITSSCPPVARRWAHRQAIVWLGALLLWPIHVWPQQNLQVFTDDVSYNVGREVRLAASGGNPALSISRVMASLRYAGETKPLLVRELSLPATAPGARHRTGYVRFWQIPFEARAGRYEIDVQVRDPKSPQAVLNLPVAASFTVHRKLMQIERVTLDRSAYTSGDAIGCTVTVINQGVRPVAGLRLEFSERYWPWIAQSSEREGVDVKTLQANLKLAAKGRTEIGDTGCATAKAVQKPTLHQFAAVVWDASRRNVLGIAFSPLVIVRPPGVRSPAPYPLQYLYPELSAVDTSTYRNFYPLGTDCAAIQFDRTHTMFPAGDRAEIIFSLQNRTSEPWRDVSVTARLLDESGNEVQKFPVAGALDLAPGTAPLEQRAVFVLPVQAGGLYRAVVTVAGTSGITLAQGTLELGVNPLPHSILVFCAHEDDELVHAGMIRAAVENHIPLRLVYFTSGDSGSCDRYYQHSCSPAEASAFGALRMDEARAALGHLGVPKEDILFLGLPDGGSGEIWFRHREASDPYLALLLASDHAPYGGLVRPNLPYARRPVIEVVKELIRKLQPEVIYTGHPDERHVDHRVNNWLVVKALQELPPEGAVLADLTLLVDQAYGPGPQTHAPYRYQKHTLHVSGEARALAQKAGWFYQSQSGNRARGNLRTFDRLPRTEIHWQVLDWKEHAGWNEKD